MDLKEFIEARPYLYHLTNRKNLDIIFDERRMLSTKTIAHTVFDKKKAKEFLRTRRPAHETVTLNKRTLHIRDQKPVIVTVLSKSLTDGDSGDFIELLNKRVFWWPTLNRLNRHYNVYAAEKPVILRVETAEMLKLNPKPEFCHLNSGATRCHPAHGGHAPLRGSNSFLYAKDYNMSIASVAEVTFIDECDLPETIWTASNPDGPWKLVE